MGTAFFVGTCFLSRQYNPVLFTVIALGACFVTLAKEDGAEHLRGVDEDRWRVVMLDVRDRRPHLDHGARLFGAWGG